MNLISPMKRTLGWAMLLTAISASAGELEPRTYVAIEAEVRELTNAGVSERVALLTSGNNTPQSEAVISEKNRQAVARAYLDNGTTPAAHAAYGSRHAAQIEAWLNANPDWQTHLDALTSELEALSSQLDALEGGN